MNLLSGLFNNHQESQGRAGTNRSALECFGFGITDTSPLELWATVIDPIAPGQLGHVLFQGHSGGPALTLVRPLLRETRSGWLTARATS
jgi:hypothetical protein